MASAGFSLLSPLKHSSFLMDSRDIIQFSTPYRSIGRTQYCIIEQDDAGLKEGTYTSKLEKSFKFLASEFGLQSLVVRTDSVSRGSRGISPFPSLVSYFRQQ